MIKIAIVDDEMEARDTLYSYCRKLAVKIHEELEITLYSRGSELVERYDDYDLIFLDIDMPEEDGISLAKKIRKIDNEVILIFVTNMAQMAIKGYEVRALDFIVKPINYYSFTLKIRSAVDMINSRKNRNIVVNSEGVIRKISTNDLFYIEVSGHYLFYHTSAGIVRQKESLRKVEEKLKDISFKRCNNCYLVNLKHVTCVNKDDIEVAGNWLKISRPKKKEFLQALANYMGGITL